MTVNYSKKIKLPIFDPKGISVKLEECIDVSKFSEYMDEIELYKKEGKIDDIQYNFLKLSATRFLKFNFENIAEYFCNANSDMQKIMQDLALVLIDYDGALKASIIEAVDFTDRILNIQERHIKAKKEFDNSKDDQW